VTCRRQILSEPALIPALAGAGAPMPLAFQRAFLAAQLHDL
jgi:hypothetical protein